MQRTDRSLPEAGLSLIAIGAVLPWLQDSPARILANHVPWTDRYVDSGTDILVRLGGEGSGLETVGGLTLTLAVLGIAGVVLERSVLDTPGYRLLVGAVATVLAGNVLVSYGVSGRVGVGVGALATLAGGLALFVGRLGRAIRNRRPPGNYGPTDQRGRSDGKP